ncbi:hypothetical protein [Halomonas sp. hl-4]|nr:hypothetical protein [Halomonas sp. hl-4]SNY98601.1 hypothetical protein SAMN04488142_3223 [Halomonas sp. hl-4]
MSTDEHEHVAEELETLIRDTGQRDQTAAGADTLDAAGIKQL